MRIVALVTNRVKIFSGTKRLPLLMVIAACLAALTIGIPRYVLEPSSAHGVKPTGSKPQGCCANIPPSLRRMIGTYYTTEDNFKSTLILNNKGPNQIVVTPILYGKNGEAHKAPPVSVGGESSYELDLNAIAENAGSKFRSGGIEFTYTGRMMEMGGGLQIVNAEKSLIFDEQFLEPGMKFSSSQLEAVYAMPFEDARVNVIVTNTTEKPLVVTGSAAFTGDRNQRTIKSQLKPYETEVVNLPHGQTKDAFAGAVSLSHDGGKGALIAMVHVQDSGRGYSESVNFTDPAQGKTNQWQGAGLRLGSVNNDPLRPVIVVRNIGNDATRNNYNYMQVNQSLPINHQRMIRMLAVSLSLTALLILMISAAHGQGSQVKLSVEAGRPVAKAILRLEEKYGWVITYEDPRYVHDSEVTDVTLKVRRDLDKYKPGEAPKVLVPRGDPLEFTYDISPNTNLPPDPAKVVQKLLDAQAANSNGGRFRLESNGRIMHVIPTMIKNSKGVLVSQESVLDTIISLPAQDRSVFDKLESICAAVSRAAPVRILGLGAYPSMFRQYRDQKGAASQKARDVLVNTFATMEYGNDLSWRLLYDPGLKVYLLNIYHVKLLDGKM